MTDPLICPGFLFAGVAAGIKYADRLDLGLIYSKTPATAAGMFTRNRVQAAPVQLSRSRLASGRCQAVIANAGNANCCTGERGMQDARAMTHYAAQALNIEENLVVPASTGVIGQPLPIERIQAAMSALTGALKPEGMPDVAKAIMTTDTRPKLGIKRGCIAGTPYTVLAAAKGAGMIRPDMATMLCFVCTDIRFQGEALKTILKTAVDASFNRITIDGDTSTNDMVVLLAGGASGLSLDTQTRLDNFQVLLTELLQELARDLVRDGEGATKLVDIIVQGAKNDADANAVADTVAHSNLVKTALFGQDANWGRILAAAGRAGVAFEPERTDIYIDGIKLVENGRRLSADAEAKATEALKTKEFKIILDLKAGSATASLITCDFSLDYVRINADYRT